MSSQFDNTVPEPEFIATDQQAAELLRLCLRKIEADPEDFIGFDTETHGRKIPIKSAPLDWMTDTVVMWSLSFALREPGMPAQYRRWCLQQQHFYYFAPFLENPGFNIAGWNIKYDGHVSWNSHIDIWQSRRPVDGLVLAQLHDENRRSHGLKQCAEDWLGLQMTKYQSLFNGVLDSSGKKVKEYETSLIELVELGHADKVSNYASFDAYAHLRLVEWLRDKLKATPLGTDGRTLWDYFIDFEMDVTRLLWRMERRGLPVDTEYLKSKIPEIDSRIDTILKEINQIAGRPINIDSPKQLADFLFTTNGMGLKPVKMTATQQPSTDEEVMDVLTEAGVPIAVKIVEARKLGKTKSTYLMALINLSDYFPDHRIHPTFNQLGARTGRLSTQTPNSQNFPRPDNDEWGIRAAFIAPPKKKLLVGDYEQVEMRIMAHFSGDAKMIKAILDGKDLHSFTVAAMNPDIKYEEVVAAKKAEHPDQRQKFLKGLRQDNKGVGFGIIYGAGPPKISTTITITDEQWKGKLNEMDDDVFERRVTRLMKKNPLLTQEQAVEQVGRHSVAGDKIEAYFQVFPQVRNFMHSTPEECRLRMTYLEPVVQDIMCCRVTPEEVNQQVEEGRLDPRAVYVAWWPENREDTHFMTVTGHAKPFGFVQTLMGRFRRLEDIDHSNYFYKSEAERQSVNTRIQGTAADIAKAAMLRIEQCPTLNRMGVMILNQVHDEIVMEVPEEYAAQALPIVKHYMENPLGDNNPALCVPIPVDLKIVSRWNEAK
jgi:DNA polymerase I-like protein with 3'-5' exonuclease and polymerase domains